MNVPELAARARERLAHAVVPNERGELHIVSIVVPEEGPTDHCRNALQAISCLQTLSPVVYMITPELGRAQRRMHAAVVLLDHGGPERLAAVHVRGAVEALLEAALDWTVFPEVKGAIARLLHAWYQLQPA